MEGSEYRTHTHVPEPDSSKEILEEAVEHYKNNKLTASEAIYGFCAWLTTRGESITLGSSEINNVADVIEEFCDTNCLDDPRSNWVEYLIRPDDY